MHSMVRPRELELVQLMWLDRDHIIIISIIIIIIIIIYYGMTTLGLYGACLPLDSMYCSIHYCYFIICICTVSGK